MELHRTKAASMAPFFVEEVDSMGSAAAATAHISPQDLALLTQALLAYRLVHYSFRHVLCCTFQSRSQKCLARFITKVHTTTTCVCKLRNVTFCIQQRVNVRVLPKTLAKTAEYRECFWWCRHVSISSTSKCFGVIARLSAAV